MIACAAPMPAVSVVALTLAAVLFLLSAYAFGKESKR